MTDVKRLLDEATPLPWYWEPRSEVLRCRIGAEGHRRGVGDYAFLSVEEWPDAPEPLDEQANAALIVYAVNHLPDYEAAVDALETIERLLRPDPAGAPGYRGRYWALVDDAHDTARVALRRLRGDA